MEVDSTWIFRFPKRLDCEPMLARELKLLPAVRPLLPVAVPVVEFVGTATADYPFAFAGYRKLAGAPAIRCSPEAIDLERLAPCLGRILSALHAFPAEEAIRLGVVRLDDFEDMRSIRDHAIETLEQLRANLQDPLWGRCRALLEREGLGSTPAPGRDALLHGDLSAEHVLIAPGSGDVVGLIDWADACLGDPAYDFKFLWVWLGDEFIDRILLHYSHHANPDFLARVRAYGICTALDEVAYGLAGGRDDNLRLGMAALERAVGGDGS